MRAAPLMIGILLVGAACDEPRELREWTAADHQQPAEPDPSRSAGATDEDPAATMARAAAALFQNSCAGCHGADGRGGGPAAPPGAQLPDLSAAAYQDERTDAEMAQVIAGGRGMMPAFATQLNERGIGALVGHVRTLRRD